MSSRRTRPRGAPLHVIPDEVGGWRVERAGAEQPLSQHDSATAAEGAAMRAALATDTPEVIVHDRYHRTHLQRHPRGLRHPPGTG